MRRRRIGRWLFGLSGLIPLLGLLGPEPDPTLLIYSLFVLLVFLRPVPEAVPTRGWHARFVLAVLGFGLLLESLSWTSNFVKCEPDPALLHPQLIPDLTLALGFYGAWALAWLILLRFFAFRPGQLFYTQGAFGVLIEQNGMVFLTGLLTLPLGLVFWLYLFVVYGAVIGCATRIAGLPDSAGKRNRWWKYPLAWLAVLLLSLTVFALWHALLQGSGIIPSPQPICIRPLF